MLLLPSANFFSKLTFSKKFFQEHHQSVKQLGSDQEFFEKKNDYEKNQQTTTKHEKFPRRQRVKFTCSATCIQWGLII